jgi:uncharacterized protein involved in response to NO
MNIKAVPGSPSSYIGTDLLDSKIPLPAQLGSSANSTHWQVFSAAPHRMLFFAGAMQVVAVVLWWLPELVARATGAAMLPPPLLPALWIHGFLMVYGIFPFFIFGFLFTVYPRWMGGPVVPQRSYKAVFALLFGGAVLFYAGLYTRTEVVVAGLVVFFTGWAGALRALLSVYASARSHGPHERLLNTALIAGLAGVGCFLVAVLSSEPLFFRLAREVGMWLFLVPVVFLVGHRMIPFFSQSGLMNYMMVRPAWGPPLMLVCAALHMLFELAGFSQWRFLADLPLAVAALHHSWVWQFRRSFHARLVAMLHIAFLWLGIAMALYALQSMAQLATGTDYFGRAPLHALGIGFFTGMVVAMASRVTLGHSGRALRADTLTWLVLMGVNAAAVLRVAGELLPAIGATLNLVAGLVWLASLLAWVMRYAPLYLAPRSDHQPG